MVSEKLTLSNDLQVTIYNTHSERYKGDGLGAFADIIFVLNFNVPVHNNDETRRP